MSAANTIDGKYQTEEAHNKGERIELIHCLRFIGLNIAIISQSHYTAQSLSLPDRLQSPSSLTLILPHHTSNQVFFRLLWLSSGLLQGYGSSKWSYPQR